MRRREFVAMVGGVAILPVRLRPGFAEQSVKIWRVGVLEQTSKVRESAYFDAFLKGLRELGYIEGQNLIIQFRAVDDRTERYPQLAAELVGLNVDVIVTRGTPAALAAKNSTSTIPVVMAAIGDPFLVVSGLASPGGNITGLSAFNSELEPKRVELIKELVPQARRIGALYNMSNPIFAHRRRELEKVAQKLGFETQLLDVQKSQDLPAAFEAAKERRTDAIIVSADGALQVNRLLVCELAASHRITHPANSSRPGG